MTVYYSPILDMIFIVEERNPYGSNYIYKMYSNEWTVLDSNYDKELIKKLQLESIGEL